MTLIVAEVPPGSPKVVRSRDGNLKDRFCGSMVNVCPLQYSHPFAVADYCRVPDHVAGSGKSVLWYVRVILSLTVGSLSPSLTSSSIIQEIKVECDSGLALMGYYYFDFRDTTKQDIRGLLSSLLAQLCAKSDSCYDILSELYSKNNAGSQQPDNRSLTECLKKMLQLPLQPMIFIIVDAVDECPNSTGFPNTQREKVLDLFEELLELNLPDLRICVTSRPEAGIQDVLEHLEPCHMSLHEESGQKTGILDYISSVVRTDRLMRKWRSEEKQLVIDVLSAKANGM